MTATATATTPPAAATEGPPAVGRGLRRQAPGAVALALLAIVPFAFGDFGLFIGQYALIYTVLGLSVVVVTGYAGLISLMPYTFAGIGAMTAGVAMASWGWPFWLAVPLAALASAPISVLVGVASVRLKGLYLAIATLTLADALGETFFRWDATTGGDVGWLITRPTLGPIDFTSDAAFYLLCLGTVGLLVWMVEGLRTSRLGRSMHAVRDNEVEAQALGINTYRTKLIALLIGGALAGLGGAFLAALLVASSPSAFWSPTVHATSILIVALVAVGGMDRALGALFGALVLVVTQQVFQGAEFFFAFVGLYSALLLIVLLRFRPGGLVEVGRRQIAVIRERPAVGIPVTLAVIALNIGGAWLFLELS